MATARTLAAAAARAFSSTATSGAGGVSMVQGASRGIGLEFVRQLLKRSDEGRVVATCRSPDSAMELQKLRQEHAPRLAVLPLDVTDESTIEELDYDASEDMLNGEFLCSKILSLPVTGSCGLDRRDPWISEPADQRNWDPFNSECDTSRDYIEQSSEVIPATGI